MKNRNEYKKTWDNLARDMNSAKKYVSGFQEEKEFKRTALKTIEILNDSIGINKEDDVLEIGCGVGRVGKELSSICNSWTGSDISNGMLTFAAERLQGKKNIELVELGTEGLEKFPENSFDVVYCTVVFMHLFEWDRYKYIQDAYRILKPSGRCFVDNIDIKSETGKAMFYEGLSFKPTERPDHLSMVSTGDELETYFKWSGYSNISVVRWDNAWVGAHGTKT